MTIKITVISVPPVPLLSPKFVALRKKNPNQPIYSQNLRLHLLHTIGRVPLLQKKGVGHVGIKKQLALRGEKKKRIVSKATGTRRLPARVLDNDRNLLQLPIALARALTKLCVICHDESVRHQSPQLSPRGRCPSIGIYLFYFRLSKELGGQGCSVQEE